jgi:hypothetical protein
MPGRQVPVPVNCDGGHEERGHRREDENDRLTTYSHPNTSISSVTRRKHKDDYHLPPEQRLNSLATTLEDRAEPPQSSRKTVLVASGFSRKSAAGNFRLKEEATRRD